MFVMHVRASPQLSKNHPCYVIMNNVCIQNVLRFLFAVMLLAVFTSTFYFTVLLLLFLLLLCYCYCYFVVYVCFYFYRTFTVTFTLLCFTLLCTFPASSWRTCILIQAPCFLLFHRLGPPDLKVFFLSWRSVALAEKDLSFNMFPPSYPAT